LGAALTVSCREAADPDGFAGLRDQRLHQIAHRAGVVLDELLLEQRGLLEELLEPPLDDLRLHGVGLLLLGGLGLVDLPLALDELRGEVLDPHRERPRRGDVEGDIPHQLLEVLGARHEVGLAVHLDQHADAAVEVDVRLDQPLGRLASSARVGLSCALLAEHVDRLLEIAARLLECPLAVHHSSARAGPELRHLFRTDLLHARHSRSLLYKNAALAPWGSKGGGWL